MNKGNRSLRSIVRAKQIVHAALPICLWTCLAACHRQTDLAQEYAHPSLEIKSADFVSGGTIPQRHTCDGADVSPPLQWSAPPAGTKSFALVMHDPDALIDFTHWLVFNISPSARSLVENASQQAAIHEGASDGMNDFDRFGYGGPCPPGNRPHRYMFHLYALDTRLDLPAGATRKALDSAIRGHVLAEGQITGIYVRTGH
jgi:Raf kinase inhibitor-like YbhB/YbcL family protein